ncbi:double-headed protease inhibitor, submandibular gland-like [Dromiciops gliroides]|uniref:double-headed protease inhibitor, submandibular gland-like n=1 Tax=Dromiciops gliroides TaxID=33562 RepID=UPI001CC4729B|nr:double-headed protease inhibitor, submandibular gland-like [Dromiciops gliroides]
MMKSVVLAFWALAITTYIVSAADNQVKVNQVKGTEVDCSRYLRTKDNRLACPRNYEPICGTDQRNYPNECLLCDSNLEKGLRTRKLYDGRCGN